MTGLFRCDRQNPSIAEIHEFRLPNQTLQGYRQPVCCWGSVFPWQASPRFSLESWRTFCQSHTALCGPFNPLAPDWMVRRGGAAILSLHKRSPVPVLYGIGKVLRVGPWSWRGLWSFRSSRPVSATPGSRPPRATVKKESRSVPEATFRAD